VRDYLDRLAEGELEDTDSLTPRETEVVKLIAEGQTNREIAAELVISDKTVTEPNILGKLCMRDRVELTRYAIRRGLVEA
jgi:DNA-binding NarL/FixJ family response regulator